jgi:NTE family protein
MNYDISQGNDTAAQVSPADKIAFVLSGGANRGALEVGVLLALLEHEIRPRILVGTSVGAINATAMAINPSLEGARWLESRWRRVTRKDVLPDNYMSMAVRLLTGGSSLFSNKRLRDFLESHLPDGMRQFADIKTAELYITAADLRTGELHVFGIDRTESILDAIMASTAFPLLLSPWEYQGHEYVDGAVVSDLPIRVAVEMKAREVYAIDVGKHRSTKERSKGVLRVIRQVLNVTAYQRFIDDMGWASKLPQDRIHYIGVDGFDDVGVRDFSHTPEMISRGHQIGLEYLRRLSIRTSISDEKAT